MNRYIAAILILALLCGCKKKQDLGSLDHTLQQQVRLGEHQLPQFFFGKPELQTKTVDLFVMPDYEFREEYMNYEDRNPEHDSLIINYLECEFNLDEDLIDFLFGAGHITVGDSVYLLGLPAPLKKYEIKEIVYKAENTAIATGGVFARIEGVSSRLPISKLGLHLAVHSMATELPYNLTIESRPYVPPAIDSVFSQLKHTMGFGAEGAATDTLSSWMARYTNTVRLDILEQGGEVQSAYFLTVAEGMKDFTCDNILISEIGDKVYPKADIAIIEIYGIVRSRSEILGDMVLAYASDVGALLFEPNITGGRWICEYQEYYH